MTDQNQNDQSHVDASVERYKSAVSVVNVDGEPMSWQPRSWKVLSYLDCGILQICRSMWSCLLRRFLLSMFARKSNWEGRLGNSGFDRTSQLKQSCKYLLQL